MKRIILLVFLLAVAFEVQAYDVPADPWAHPRIYLHGAFLDSLQARAARNTEEWVELEDWVLDNLATNPASWQTGVRIGSAGNAVNFALAYQVDITHPRAYAQKAYNTIIAIDSMCDVNSTTYDTISAITQYNSGYNDRRIVYAASLVYDWCEDGLTTGQWNRLGTLINLWMKDWYLNRRDYDDAGTSCHTPTNNYFGGHMLALMSAGYALYYDYATYPERFVSYARDTMAVQSANTFLGRDIIWQKYGTYNNSAKGGLGPDGWPGYGDDLVRFCCETFRLISDIESAPVSGIFESSGITGFSFPQEYILSVMYGHAPHTNFSGGQFSVYDWGDTADDRGIANNMILGLENAIGCGVQGGIQANDTIQLAKWWSDTYREEEYIEHEHDWSRFINCDPTIVPIDPEVDDSALGNSWLLHGISLAYYRDDWHDESCGDISFEMRGGSGKNDHGSAAHGSFRLNAGDYLVSSYAELSNTAGGISQWGHSGLWVQDDGSSGLTCTRQFNRRYLCGVPSILHYNNTDTLLYYALDLTPVYPNCSYISRNSHILHKSVEWLYIKADSALLMMDHAITDNSNYRRLVPIAACDTVWAAKESNKQWQIWTETEPTAYGTMWRVAGGSSIADLIVDCNYPRTGVNSTACLRKWTTSAETPTAEWRQVDSLAVPATDCIMLHTMKIVAHDDPFTAMTPTNVLGLCAVSAFRSNRIDTLDYLVVFNADSAAQEFTGDSIIFGHSDEPRENTTVIVANLASSTEYFWHAIPASGLLAVTLSKADPGTYTSVTSDTAGIAVFDLGAPAAGDSCPTVTKDNIASQGVGATYGTLHLDTDFNAHVGFRYHPTGNHPWVYRHDADADSTSHTISVTGLELDSLYVWESNTKVVDCDSVAYGDSTDLQTTACPTVTASGFASQQIGRTEAILHFHTDELAHAHFKVSRVEGGTGVVSYYQDADADSTQHTILIRNLKPNREYTWSTSVTYAGCDSTAYANPTVFRTKGAGISKSKVNP